MKDKEIKLEEIETSLKLGRTEGDTRPGRTRKKPKGLSECESEDRE